MRDPSRNEMIAFLRADPYVREFENPEFDIEEAIYWFAYDFHGGQWSNLYSALSTSEFHPGPYAFQPEQPYLYDILVEEYAND